MSFRSTFREPSKRMELVIFSSMLAAIPFIASKGLDPGVGQREQNEGTETCSVGAGSVFK